MEKEKDKKYNLKSYFQKSGLVIKIQTWGHSMLQSCNQAVRKHTVVLNQMFQRWQQWSNVNEICRHLRAVDSTFQLSSL